MVKFSLVKDKGFKIVFLVYILALIADIATTFMVGEAKSVLEANPLYNFLGLGFFPIILLNILIAWLIWWIYTREKSSPTSRFYFIMIMLLIISMRLIAIPYAVERINNPITIEQAEQLIIENPTAKIETMKTVVYTSYPPFIFAIIGFLFWKLDHKVEKKS